jgi:hypothetical protein
MNRRIDRAARPIERKMARAMLRAVERTREKLLINDLAMAIASRDVKAAMRMFPAALFEEPLGPVGTVARDAVVKGGKVGAEIVNKEAS